MKRSLNSISASNNLSFYTNRVNIPNQNLVSEIINHFEAGEGKRAFSTLEFLNLFWKQYQYLLQNLKDEKKVISHFQELPLSELQRHILYGVFLKWFGGYPARLIDIDDDREKKTNHTLKVIQKEFLAYPGKTPEKEFCRIGVMGRTVFPTIEKIENAILRGQITREQANEAYEKLLPQKSKFTSFDALFRQAIEQKIVKVDDDYFTEKVKYETEFENWLVEIQGWHPSDKTEYFTFLDIPHLQAFVIYKMQLADGIGYKIYGDLVKEFWNSLHNSEFDYTEFIQNRITRFTDYAYILSNIIEAIKNKTFPKIGVKPNSNGRWVKGTYCEYDTNLKTFVLQPQFEMLRDELFSEQNMERLNEIAIYAERHIEQLHWETSLCGNDAYKQLKDFENFGVEYKIAFDSKRRLYGNHYTEKDHLKDCITHSEDVINDRVLARKSQGGREWTEPYNRYIKQLYKSQKRTFEAKLKEINTIEFDHTSIEAFINHLSSQDEKYRKSFENGYKVLHDYIIKNVYDNVKADLPELERLKRNLTGWKNKAEDDIMLNKLDEGWKKKTIDLLTSIQKGLDLIDLRIKAKTKPEVESVAETVEQENNFTVSTIEDWLSQFKESMSEEDYNTLISALIEYFEKGKFPIHSKRIQITGRLNKKLLGWNLNRVFAAKGMGITKELLKFAKNHISIFSNDDLDENDIRNSNLYKYFTTKTQ